MNALNDHGRSADRANPAVQADLGTTSRHNTRARTAGSRVAPTGRSEVSFPCRAPNCTREFLTATGRGVHERRAHTDWHDQAQSAQVRNVKERWTSEERDLMALKEVELTKKGVNFINMELMKYSGRTLESIKGQRRRLDYKNKVREIMEQWREADEEVLQDTEQREVQENPDGRGSEVRDLRTYLMEAEPITGEHYNTKWLNEISNKVHVASKEQIGLELAAYLRETFPPEKETTISHRRPAQTRYNSNKQRKKMEYARIQDLWKKDAGKCVQRILEDRMDQEKELPQAIMEPYWRAVFTREIKDSPKLPKSSEVHEDLWAPITTREIKYALPKTRTAPGPDEVSAKTLRKVPHDLLARIFTLFIWLERLPENLYLSKTILIPKKKDAVDPGDYRPITMSSVIVRTFHRVLANRLKSLELDPRQRAFRNTNGCAENVALLDMALKYHQQKSKKMFVAVIDMAKAFDSVSFPALRSTLRWRGLPGPMQEYIFYMYENSKTKFQHGSWESGSIHPTCGVKQGDPLSPMLFNLVMDGMLKSISRAIGVEIDNIKINILAFADDLVLMASTKEGLQNLIDRVTGYLRSCGLVANPAKCASVAVISVPKSKKTIIDSSCRFKVCNKTIPSLQRTDIFTYLGTAFTADGVKPPSGLEILEKKIESLSSAPLKPQQRLWALRTVVIPSTMYSLVHCRVKYGFLRSLDKILRKAVRKWLHLPKDCPNSYIHAGIPDGGLGVTSLRWMAPLQRLKTLNYLRKNLFLRETAITTYLNAEITEVEKRLKNNAGSVIKSNVQLDAMWASLLHGSVDGSPLKNSRDVSGQHAWVRENTKLLSGRDFVNCCKARINALPSKSRTSRGRMEDRSCRAGCRLPETNNHAIQVCHRTHGARIRRHNAVASYVARNLQNQGYAVEIEPIFQTAEGKRKPDVVATLGSTTLILDAQILGEQEDLEKYNKQKINYYQLNNSLCNAIKTKYKSTTILTHAITLSWRGIWCRTSATDLMTLGAVRKKDLRVISTRVLIGALVAWRTFNRMTSRWPGGARRHGARMESQG